MSVAVQTGGTSSFITGNQTTSSPISNSNILWGVATTAMLGATLADWQKKREEEAERLAALRNSGGEEEEPSGKKTPGQIAYEKMMQQKHIVGESQAFLNEKAAQTQAAKLAKAAQADMTQKERFEVYQAENRQTALETQRTGERNAEQIVDDYEARMREQAIQAYRDGEQKAESIAEQAKQNAVSAARWAGVASVAQAKQDSEEENKTWLQKAWENTKTFVQEKIVEPVTTFWNEKIYEPYIQPAAQWVQENIIQPVTTFWNEKVYKPYIQPVVTWVNENIVEPVKTVFQENPKAAWGTAAVVTTATIAGTVYYIDCYGAPSFTPPVSALINFAGVFSLPITGWLTTSRKQRVYGILVGILMLGMLLSACGGGTPGNTATPTNTLCPPTATPTETPTLTLPTATPDVYQNLKSTFLPSGNYAMLFLDDWIDEYDLANQSYNEDYNAFLKGLGYSDTEIGVMDTKTKAMIVWQNYYNKDILEQAQIYGIDPALLKGQMLAESNGAIDPGGYLNDGTYDRNDLYVGLMQISRGELANVLGGAPEELIAQTLNLYSIMGIHSPLPEYSQKRYKTYSDYYLNGLSDEQRQDFADIALHLVDGQCFVVADASMGCGGVNPSISDNGINYLVPMVNEGSTSIQFAAAINANNRKNFVDGGYISSENWSQLSKVDQDKLMLAAFNGGMDGIGEAVNAIVIQNGKLSSWDEVQAELQKGKETYTPSWCQAIVYPDNAVCYANGGNNCTIKLASCNP